MAQINGYGNSLDSDDLENLLTDFVNGGDDFYQNPNLIGNSGSFDDQDDMDIKFPLVPVEKSGPPPRGDFTGQYNFQMKLNGDPSDRKKPMYSQKLNRVFLGMMAEMAVRFSWNWNALEDRQVWVRATIILASDEQQEARIIRCHNHKVLSDPSNKDVPPNVITHVLRSARQDENNVTYCGSEEEKNKWLSVAVALPSHPPAGAHTHQHVYRFCCKHSCVSGINRRRIEVLFTLEDCTGEVLGRQSLGVRVCSCPRRDMEKEELESGIPPPEVSSRKRPLIVSPRSVEGTPSKQHFQPDTRIYNIPQMQIVGQDNYETIISIAHALCVERKEALVSGDPSIPSIQRVVNQIKSIQQTRPAFTNQ